MQSDDLGLVERLASAGIVPAGWFLPWNEYHGYQQVAEQHNAEPDLVPLFGLDALIYLDGETQALLSGERAVLPQTKQHAEALYTVAVACLKSYGVDVEAELAAKDAAIERRVAERDEAREALKPFAALYTESMRDYPDGTAKHERPDDRQAWGFNNANLMWGDFRRARQALKDAP